MKPRPVSPVDNKEFDAEMRQLLIRVPCRECHQPIGKWCIYPRRDGQPKVIYDWILWHQVRRQDAHLYYPSAAQILRSFGMRRYGNAYTRRESGD